MNNSPVYIPNKLPNYIPKLPPPQTPGPKKIDDIQSNAKSRFAGIIYVQKEANYSPEDYLSEYDHWELYSETKSYSKRPFQGSYKGGIRQYQNYLLIFNDENDNETYYVIFKRIRGELENLIPYCPCINCQASCLNPIKYIWCDYCTGCIKSGPGFAKKEYINIANQLMKSNGNIKDNNIKDDNIKDDNKQTDKQANIISNFMLHPKIYIYHIYDIITNKEFFRNIKNIEYLIIISFLIFILICIFY